MRSLSLICIILCLGHRSLSLKCWQHVQLIQGATTSYPLGADPTETDCTGTNPVCQIIEFGKLTLKYSARRIYRIRF